MRRAEIVLVAMVAQAAVGYTQYFNGDPVGLVAVHVAGASVLVVAVLRSTWAWRRILALMRGPRRRATRPREPSPAPRHLTT